MILDRTSPTHAPARLSTESYAAGGRVGRRPVQTKSANDAKPVEVDMTEALEGRKYWQHGDHRHVWVVDAVVHDRTGQAPFAILVSEDGRNVREVSLADLRNPDLYTPVPEPSRTPAAAR